MGRRHIGYAHNDGAVMFTLLMVKGLVHMLMMIFLIGIVHITGSFLASAPLRCFTWFVMLCSLMLRPGACTGTTTTLHCKTS